MRRVTLEEAWAICKDYLNGLGVMAIAEKYRRTDVTIRKTLRDADVYIERTTEQRRNKLLKNDQLCWACRHAALGKFSPCPWAATFEPVKGWTAYETKIATHYEGYTISYRITACPLFERG